MWRRVARGFAFLAAAWAVTSGGARTQSTQTIAIRGHDQALHLYGPPTGSPIIVSSGDGGWIHLAPHVAELLARTGYFVVGFDAKDYLSGFTSGRATLHTLDEPGDYRVLAAFAARASGQRPVLIGVSEGAGLSLLAATDTATKHAIAGVIGLGLPDMNELGWRWRDSLIYLTHRAPDEPAFSAASIVNKVAPIPLAAIHATGDEFVPVADVQKILRNARAPARLWLVQASDHRFSDNLGEFDRRLVDALAWVRQNAPR